MTALEQELERAQTRLRESSEEIAELERRRAEAAGSVAVAERAVDELEQRLVEQRESLTRFEQVEEAQRQLAARIGERDVTATDIAETVTQLLGGLDELVAARERITTAQERVGELAGRSAVGETPPEPAVFRETWDRLIDRIRDDLGAELEHDLVEAAARSPVGSAIDDLPVHLRALAVERRRALFRRFRQDEEATSSAPPTASP